MKTLIFRRIYIPALLLHSACGAPYTPPHSQDALAPAPTVDNVILIVIDTLRADHLQSYGYDRQTAPFLDSLAAEGVALPSYASSSWTRPATATLLTGLFPQTHSANTRTEGLPPDTPFIAEFLTKTGHECRTYTTNGNVGSSFGFNRGYTVFRQYEGGGKPDAPAEMSVAREVLDQVDSPYFFYLHLIDPHDPYVPRSSWPPDGSGERAPTYVQPQQVRKGETPLTEATMRKMIDQYDAEVFELDLELRKFFVWLAEGDYLENTLVVITSDHGEEFGEHNGVAHGQTLYEESVAVPLIFWTQDGLLPATSSSQVFHQVDLMPTLLHATGASSIPNAVDGRSYWAEICAGEYVEPESHYLHLDLDSIRLLGLRRGQMKVIFDLESGKAKYFDLGRGGIEGSPLPFWRAWRERALKRDLREFDAFYRERAFESVEAEVAEKVRDQLKALGYLE